MRNEREFQIAHGYQPKPKQSICDYVRNTPKPDPKKILFKVFPILTWLPLYDIRKFLLADIVAGLIVGVMKVSQGLAYAQLAGQHPVYGLYTCLFPPLPYALFASSKHLSFGSFATSDIMIGAFIETLVPSPNGTTTNNSSMTEIGWEAVYDERILYVTVITFLCGCFLVFIAVFKLGFLARLFSQPLQRGFIFAVVCYLYVSQSITLLGISIVKNTGPLSFFKDIYAIFEKLTKLDGNEQITLLYTIIVSVVSIIFLFSAKMVNNKFKHKFPLNIPFPGELLLLIVATVVSEFTELYNIVSVIGNVPQGLPYPKVPDLSRTPNVIGDSVAITVVGMTVALSLGTNFADKGKYPLDSTQEIQAVGFSNLFGSFFSCLPAFGAMSRSCVQFESGGKSQFVGWFSSIFIIVILFAGPVLNSTPSACLSAMVVVSVANLLLHIRDLKTLWVSQKLDCTVWIITCVGTLLTSITLGLAIGVCAALLSNIVKISFPKPHELHLISNTGIYKRAGLYDKKGQLTNHVIVLSLDAPISFLNAAKLSRDMQKVCGIDAVKERQKNSEQVPVHSKSDGENENSRSESSIPSSSNADVTNDSSDVTSVLKPHQTEFIVLDCSGINFVDSVGVTELKKIIIDFERIGINILLAACSESFLQTFVATGYDEILAISYVSIDDAVQFTKSHTQVQNVSAIEIEPSDNEI
uniref:Solute carrier family 26 member 6-like n=1 Tax=Phallusia mammillata TaxID=59560 RepID=A0A6F9DTJ5_9ASCI|nr:solute carrier family 26 member 6-like [Phallusia mammillata]